MEEDEEGWSIDLLGPGLDLSTYPNRQDTRMLVQQYRETWSQSETLTPDNVISWFRSRLGLGPEYDHDNWNKAVEFENIKMTQLQHFMKKSEVEDMETKTLFMEAAAILNRAKMLLVYPACMVALLQPRDMRQRRWCPPENLASLTESENLFAPDDKSCTDWQKLYFAIRNILEGCNYRRSGKAFFKQIVNKNGDPMCAYEEKTTIENFVASHASPDTAFDTWKLSTSNRTNFTEMVNYLETRPLAEAPDLEENRRIRSYAGDANGNYSGIYDHYDDMFYPYDCAEEWKEMAQAAQEKRRKLFDPNYTCTPPMLSEVCVVHLDCPFIHDIEREIEEVDADRLFLVWVEVRDFECRHERAFPKSRLVCEVLGCLLVTKADESYGTLPDIDGPVSRIRLTMEEWEDAGASDVDARTFVEHEGRYFRVHTGTRWNDISTPELDRIYECQNFSAHDRFFLWAAKGRLFFPVHERDTHEGTIFFLGTGGSGKSTVMKVFMYFWPPHLRGILSANIQPQFGMDAVSKGDVAFCTEMSEHPNLVQEEWQDATGAGTVSCSRKFKDPNVIAKWHAQFWWAGNDFPKGLNNKNHQVSRRLWGVHMYKPVHPRRGDIMPTLLKKLGPIQRKAMLAYQDWCMQQGPIDPNSEIDALPPAFRDFQRTAQRDTDPVLDFITDTDYIERHPSFTMLYNEFRLLYTQFRTDKNMGRGKTWGEDVYRMAFADKGISISTTTYEADGVVTENVKVITGLRAVQR